VLPHSSTNARRKQRYNLCDSITIDVVARLHHLCQSHLKHLAWPLLTTLQPGVTCICHVQSSRPVLSTSKRYQLMKQCSDIDQSLRVDKTAQLNAATETSGKVYSLQHKLRVSNFSHLLPQHRHMVENQPITIHTSFVNTW